MKKFTFLAVGLILLTSNVFALDLSRFTGTWGREENGKLQTISITYAGDVLRVNGLLDDDDFKMDVLSRGTITVEGIPVTFTSGNMFDDTFIITVHLRLSEAFQDDEDSADMFSLISLALMEESAKLKVQLLGAGWSSDEGLVSDVETWVFEKKE